jgi:structural maintenance of chromosome 4
MLWYFTTQEGEDYELIPGTEFTVARTATRSNTSDYYINGRKVPVKDVTDKLKVCPLG